jgi:hypothetical protein
MFVTPNRQREIKTPKCMNLIHFEELNVSTSVVYCYSAIAPPPGLGKAAKARGGWALLDLIPGLITDLK